jgi:predicted DNA-binding ribbon-helix-helix protein
VRDEDHLEKRHCRVGEKETTIALEPTVLKLIADIARQKKIIIAAIVLV